MTSVERLALRVQLSAFAGTTLPAEVADLLGDGLGGVCLFGSNTADGPAAVRALTHTIRDAGPRAVIAVDEEGGDVTRLHARDGQPGARARPRSVPWTTSTSPARPATRSAPSSPRSASPSSWGRWPTSTQRRQPGHRHPQLRSGPGPGRRARRGVADRRPGGRRRRVRQALPGPRRHRPGQPPRAAGRRRRRRHPGRARAGPVRRGIRRRRRRGDDLPHRAARDRPGPAGDAEPARCSRCSASSSASTASSSPTPSTWPVPPAAAASPRPPSRRWLAGADLLCLGADKDAALVREVQAAVVAAVRSGSAVRRSGWSRPPTGSPGSTPTCRPHGRPVARRRPRQLAGARRAVVRRRASCPTSATRSWCRVDTDANIAVGDVPWGLAPDRVTAPSSAALAGLPAGRPLVVQVRDAHRHPEVRSLLTTVADWPAGRPSWSSGAGPARTTAGCRRICTRGDSRPDAGRRRRAADGGGVEPVSDRPSVQRWAERRARHRRDQDPRPGRRRRRDDPGRGPRAHHARVRTGSWSPLPAWSRRCGSRPARSCPAPSGSAYPGLVDVDRGAVKHAVNLGRRRRLAPAAPACSPTGWTCRSSSRTTSTPPRWVRSRSAARTTSSTSASAPAWRPGWCSTVGCAGASTVPPARSATCPSTRPARPASAASAAAWRPSPPAARWRPPGRPATYRPRRRCSPPLPPGEVKAIEVRDRFVAGVADAVRALSLAVDPQTVVLGGGVAHVGEPLRLRGRRRPCGRRPRRRRSWPRSSSPTGCGWSRPTTRWRRSVPRASAGTAPARADRGLWRRRSGTTTPWARSGSGCPGGSTPRGAATSTPQGLVQRRELEYVAVRDERGRAQRLVLLAAAAVDVPAPSSTRPPTTSRVAVKGGRYITHMKRLADVETALANFLASGVLAPRRAAGADAVAAAARTWRTTSSGSAAFLDLLPRTTAGRGELAARPRRQARPATGR